MLTTKQSVYVAKSRKKEFARRRAILSERKEAGCLHCGMKNPICLDFHHREPSNREFNPPSEMYVARERWMRELAKCDVLCKNCHAIEHARLAQLVEPQAYIL